LHKFACGHYTSDGSTRFTSNLKGLRTGSISSHIRPHFNMYPQLIDIIDGIITILNEKKLMNMMN
jgi:hypothetical protein